MTCVPPIDGGSYTPAFWKPECSRSCFARASASPRMSAFVPNRRHPVGHALMHAGSSPWPTRSEHSVHLYTFFVVLLNFGMSNGHPDTQYWQPMQFSCWKSTMPFVYCTMAPSAGHARRQPGSSQCMHWSLRINHCSAPFSPRCSLNLIRFQKFHDVDGIVWYVLSNVVCW